MTTPTRHRVPARDTAERADVLTAAALLNCVIREVGAVTHRRGTAEITLPSGRVLYASTRGEPHLLPRATGHAEDADHRRLTLDDLADLVADELGADRLAAEVTRSRDVTRAVLQGPRRVDDDVCVAAEQSLVAGHRHHPAPKARDGAVDEILRHAPETGARFRLRWLGIRAELVRDVQAWDGASAVLDDRDVPPGYRALPVHPWQFALLMRGTALPRALADGAVLDLGGIGAPVTATSSVRTVDTGTGYLKLALSVRITNCLRVNPAHEQIAAVTLTRLLAPLAAELHTRWGTTVLGEPAARTVTSELGDQLGVIARNSLPPGRFVPAAALAEPDPTPAVAAHLEQTDLVAWWDRYLAGLLPPVLHAWTAHGVVFEAHLQNVLVDLDRPERVVLRDLEGVKLTGGAFLADLADLAGVSARVRDHLTYPPELAWDRVAYCLLVNNVAGLLGALADRHPDLERTLWARVRVAIRAVRAEDDSPQLRELAAGVPVPAKTNLLTRARGLADRDSGYVPVRLPL